MLQNHPTLFASWRSPKTRRIHPVGRLTFEAANHLFEFHYIRSAQTAMQDGFTPFPEFPSFETRYRGTELFPLFANRVMPSSRPGYSDFLATLGLDPKSGDPMAVLARTGGPRETDQIELFPAPEVDAENNYTTPFFMRAIRYMPQPATEERILKLAPGEKLFWMLDVQNPADINAIAVRTDDNHLIGYLPSYLTSDFWKLKEECASTVIQVEQVNRKPAEAHHRLLCKLRSCWPQDFSPFTTEAFQPIPR